MNRSVRDAYRELGVLARSPREALLRRWMVCASIGAFASALPALLPAEGPSAHHRIVRLFSSPEQRIELDRMRNDADFGREAAAVAGAPEPETAPEIAREAGREPAVPALTFNGIALRGDGHRVTWVNGVETATGSTGPRDSSIAVAHAPGVHIRISLPGSSVSPALKPGQTVDFRAGRVLDAYEHAAPAVAGGPTRSGTVEPIPCDPEHGGAVVADSCPSVAPAPAPPAEIGRVREARSRRKR